MQPIGGKASALQQLTTLGYRVPRFFVLTEADQQTLTPEYLVAQLESLSGAEYFAVRSSANLEDGQQHSFAGQFETKLFVTREQLLDSIREVAAAKHSARVNTYLQQNDLYPGQLQLAIVVQEMIGATASGVAFSKNPLKPYKNEQIVTAVFGLGEGLVSGHLVADTCLKTSSGAWDKQLAEKNQQLVYRNGALQYEDLPAEKQQEPALSDTQLEEISAVLTSLEKQLGSPQDIEFCYLNNTFYLLQSRLITTIRADVRHVIWDNSNIVESYPGITLPLTFSFILKIYCSVYYNFALMLGVPRAQVEANREVFDEMLGHIKGRVYYHLIHWYKALAMLPAYQINAAYMEKMMGVTEPLGVSFSLKAQPGKWASYWNLLRTAFRMLQTNARLPKQKQQFREKVAGVIQSYKNKDYSAIPAAQVWQDYLSFKNILVNEWTPPLANDLLAMIYFGTLEKLCTKWLGQPHLHTELVVGKFPLKSVEPARLLNRIVSTAEQEQRLEIIRREPASLVWEHCVHQDFGQTGALILTYIEQYGARSIGELKLENDTFSQNPESLIRILQSYKTSTEHTPAKTARPEDYDAGLPWLKRRIFRYVAHKAAETVADRENLRFDRTFGFGTVRRFFWTIGQKWEKEGVLDHFRDIFYLNESELAAYFQQEISPAELRARVSARKVEFAAYAEITDLPGRIHEYGEELDLDVPVPVTDAQMHGIPCCAGEVTGQVRILRTPDEVKSLDGDILVTTSTDPGWITIFQSASAILVERGSTLSHAAIVSREMGIPCIVGIKGITKLLKTGDRIRMNGKTGIIEIL
ncbi:MAG TPA: phosphoenolpyruvate synthase [Saprospirales bacterium]|nr:phosphoenolpyruvate synthase [Saprospirales bacterium]